MTGLILTTYDWVPERPRGWVRDLRIRWALEEAGLAYRVATTPFHTRGADHLAHQPFAQVPWLTDGDRSLFESGAILLHLGERSPVLMPHDPRARSDVTMWLIAAMNSVECIALPWGLMDGRADDANAAERAWWGTVLKARLDRLEPLLAAREWLVGAFSVADIMMADVLRECDGHAGLAGHPAARAYVARATARPAFARALADQLAHFSGG